MHNLPNINNNVLQRSELGMNSIVNNFFEGSLRGNYNVQDREDSTMDDGATHTTHLVCSFIVGLGK